MYSRDLYLVEEVVKPYLIISKFNYYRALCFP